MFFKTNRKPIKLPVNYNALRKNQRRYIREEYVRIQHNKCCYCKSSLNGPPRQSIAKIKIHKRLFPKGFYDNPIHLHHNHDTGMTIGAMHAHCNAVSWEHYGV